MEFENEAAMIELHDRGVIIHTQHYADGSIGWNEGNESGKTEVVIPKFSITNKLFDYVSSNESDNRAAIILSEQVDVGSGYSYDHKIKKLMYEERDNGTLAISAVAYYMDGNNEEEYNLNAIYRGSYTIWPL